MRRKMSSISQLQNDILQRQYNYRKAFSQFFGHHLARHCLVVRECEGGSSVAISLWGITGYLKENKYGKTVVQAIYFISFAKRQ